MIKPLFAFRHALPRRTELALGALGFILFLTIWHVTARSGVIRPEFLPTPFSVAQAFVRLFTERDFASDIVVSDGRVEALVVMSLNIEVVVGGQSAIFSAEPKLRDGFLQVMFDHANIGGFSGNFTAGTNMRALRNELLRVAKEISGDIVTDVLIIDIVRQDS